MRLALQQSLNICEKEREAGRAPRLAFLGPPGSGKTEHLYQLYEALITKTWNDYFDCLKIDLRFLPVGSSDDIFRPINTDLIKYARKLEIPITSGASAESPGLRFDSILIDWLKHADKNLVLFFDHLDSVPRHFAHQLKQHLRDLLERDNFDSTANNNSRGTAQLGLVVAGAISLFELRQDLTSPLLMCEPIILPQQERRVRKQLVKEQMMTRLKVRRVADETINYLADATGAEPIFLIPLLEKLSETASPALEKESVQEAIEALGSNQGFDSVFWHLALHLWSDQEVRRIVREIHRNKDEKPPLSDIDVDPYHLSGAIILEGRTPRKPYPKYRPRNTIVNSFLKKILPYYEGQNPSAPALEVILNKLRELDQAKAHCVGSDTIWKAVKHLKTAWALVTPYHRSSEDEPSITIYVGDKGGWGWWVDPLKKEVTGPEKQISDFPEDDATRTAIYNAWQGRTATPQRLRAFLGWSENYLSLAVSLSAIDPYIFVVATLPRERAGLDFTEFSLNHWILFLQSEEVKRSLVNLTLAQLGLDQIEKATHPQPEKLDIGCDNIQRVYWSKSGVVWVSRTSVEQFPGAISSDEENILKQLLRKSMTLDQNENSAQEVFANLREVFGYRLKDSLKKIEGLTEKLQRYKSFEHLISVTDAEGLLLALELFPTDSSSFLSLDLPVTRQLYGTQVSPERCITFPQLIDSLQQRKEALNAVLVVSDPYGDLKASADEVAGIKRIIEKGCEIFDIRSNVELIESEEATLSNIAKHLWHKSTHIFHYVGHGGALSNKGHNGALLLRDPDEGYELVDFERLRSMLRDASAKIWLAYINSCRSASLSDSAVEPKGIGKALLDSGVPNFLGFREPISDASAKFFAEKFYERLFPSTRTEKAFDLGDAVLAARQEASMKPEHVDSWVFSLLLTMGR